MQRKMSVYIIIEPWDCIIQRSNRIICKQMPKIWREKLLVNMRW